MLPKPLHRVRCRQYLGRTGKPCSPAETGLTEKHYSPGIAMADSTAHRDTASRVGKGSSHATTPALLLLQLPQVRTALVLFNVPLHSTPAIWHQQTAHATDHHPPSNDAGFITASVLRSVSSTCDSRKNFYGRFPCHGCTTQLIVFATA
jgi:hypothetical protein